MMSILQPSQVSGRIAGVVAIAAAAFAFPASSAADVIPLTLEDLVAVADEIVTVRVTDNESRFAGSPIVTTSKFEVLESLKGKMSGTQEVTYLGGNVGGIVMAVPQSVPLEPGEEAILFLSRSYDRMPKSVQEQIDLSSPINTSFQIVGGFQGKFSLVSAATEESNKTRKGAEPLPTSSLVVKRRALVTDVTKSAAASEITYEALREAIDALVVEHIAAKSSKGLTDEITGIVGKFAKPPKTDNPVVRAFDPYPSVLSLTPEEYEQYSQQVWERVRAQQAEADKSSSDNKGATPSGSAND